MIIGIVVNEKGAERAIATGAVRRLGFPYSISPSFWQRNQRQTQKESLRDAGGDSEAGAAGGQAGGGVCLDGVWESLWG